MENELHRVDKHPRWQQVAGPKRCEDEEGNQDKDYNRGNLANNLDQICQLVVNETDDWLPELGAERHFQTY